MKPVPHNHCDWSAIVGSAKVRNEATLIRETKGLVFHSVIFRFSVKMLTLNQQFEFLFRIMFANYS